MFRVRGIWLGLGLSYLWDELTRGRVECKPLCANFLIRSKQEELSQQGRLVESLRTELDSALEAKNEMENRYGDSLKETETLKKERDDVMKSFQVLFVHKCYLFY